MKKNILIIYFVMLILLICPIIVNADWASCGVNLNEKKSYSKGDIITYDLGTMGVTSNTAINGFHYHIQYDSTILEVISEKNGGVGSYRGWEKKELGIIYPNNSKYHVVEVTVETEDKSKFVLPSEKNTTIYDFIKLGYVKFKVISDNVDSTKLTLIENFDNVVNYGYSAISYKMIYDYKNGEISKKYDSDNYLEVCYDKTSTRINIEKSAYLDKILINNVDIKNFDKNVYNYDLNYTTNKINISALAADGLKISGDIGEKTLNDGKNVFKIVVTTSSGNKNEYILNINYQNDKSDVNTLKSLSLSSGKINFKPETNEYNINVDYEIDKISIKSELTDNKATYVKDFGNRKVDLKVGKNVILVKVQSEKGNVNVYTLNVTRKQAANTSLIKKFNISGYDIDFDSDTKNYSLKVDSEVDKLDIEIVLGNKKSSYKISGNENLKNGSKVYIKVIDENEKEYVYIISIVKEIENIEIDADVNDNEIIVNNEPVKETKNMSNKDLIIISLIIAVIVVGVVFGISVLLNKKRNNYN